MQKRSRTSAEQIRQQIASRIICGDLAPGVALDETSLAAEFSVSRTPIREALRLLAASGLVDQRAHAQASVAKPDTVKLRGMFEVMGYLEALCAGLSAVAMTARQRNELDGLHMRMAAMVRDGDHASYVEANEAFHSCIYEGAGNGYLAELAHSTRQPPQPFRRAQFRALGRLGRSHAEHGLVVDAILQGERSRAQSAMQGHIAIVEVAFHELTGA